MSGELREEEEKCLRLQATLDKLDFHLATVSDFRGVEAESVSALRNSLRAVEKLRELLGERDTVAARETAFKETCKEEMKAMEEEVDRLKQGGPDADVRLLPLLIFFRKWLLAMRGRSWKRREAVSPRPVSTQRNTQEEWRVCSAPWTRCPQASRSRSTTDASSNSTTRVSLFPEKRSAVASKHRETKQYFTEHNTLLDVQAYVEKEMEMLSKIEDVLEKTRRAEYQESFRDNLEMLLRGVEINLEKQEKVSLSCLVQSLQVGQERKAAVDDLQERLNELLSSHKAFYRHVNEFQAECQRNEKLREELRAKGIEAD